MIWLARSLRFDSDPVPARAGTGCIKRQSWLPLPEQAESDADRLGSFDVGHLPLPGYRHFSGQYPPNHINAKIQE